MRKIFGDYGKAGWVVIIYCFLLFYLYIALINDGTNVLASRAAENIGCQPADILQANGYAGIIAVIGYIISGQINNRLGPRLTCGVLLTVSGAAYILCGNTRTFTYKPQKNLLRADKVMSQSASFFLCQHYNFYLS